MALSRGKPLIFNGLGGGLVFQEKEAAPGLPFLLWYRARGTSSLNYARQLYFPVFDPPESSRSRKIYRFPEGAQGCYIQRLPKQKQE